MKYIGKETEMILSNVPKPHNNIKHIKAKQIIVRKRKRMYEQSFEVTTIMMVFEVYMNDDIAADLM